LESIYIFSTGDAQEPARNTFHEFGRACDWVSHQIHPSLPVQSVFGVILVTDVRHYQVALFGLMREGFVVSSQQILALDT